MPRFFPFDMDLRFAPLWSVLGADDRRNGVTITDDGRLVAELGRYRAEAPVSTLRTARATGPYRWWKVMGLRLSLADNGLTFGTNARRGVCLEFDEPVPKVVGIRGGHPGLTVTVADVDGLLAELGARR